MAKQQPKKEKPQFPIFLALRIMILAIVVSAFISYPAEAILADNAPPSECVQPKTTDNSTLQQLRKVVLYVSFPSVYPTAESCLENEEACASRYPLIAGDKEKWAEHIKFLKEKYTILPAYLQPKQLTQALKQEIEKKLSPFLMRGPGCGTPEIEILQSSEFVKATSDKDTLGVLVGVEVQEETQPNIVVIRTSVYRKPSEAIHWRTNFGATLLAIPLNNENPKIEKLLQQYISNSIPSGTSPLTQD